MPFSIKNFGTYALLLEWEGNVNTETLFDMLGFAAYLKKEHLNESSWEFVPIYKSLLLLNKSEPDRLWSLKVKLPIWYSNYPGPSNFNSNRWELPVCYDAEMGLDIIETAKELGITTEKVIQLHTQQDYPVYGIGFLPGFLYLGGLPETLNVPRKSTPRLNVPEGSVGLAGFQTGIYPQLSPGGWNIIGKCPIPLFDASRNPPCFIAAGDTVRFVSVNRATFDLITLEVAVGVYDYSKRYDHDSG
ncbi:MAG: hypothetical protein RLZZ241_1847 [Bacteroidota bacterium]